MPVDVIRVSKVLPRTVGSSFHPLEKFDVVPELAAGELSGPIYGTFNALMASLCQRASETDQAVRVIWRDSRYGRELVDVTLVREEVA